MKRVITGILAKSRLRTQHRENFMPWDRIRTMALIVAEEDNVSKRAIDTWIESTGKNIEVFYVELRAKQPSYADWTCFTRKDSNVLRLPKKPVISALSAKRFDVVLNTAGAENAFAAWVATALRAANRCSCSYSAENAELIIEKNNAALGDYLSHVVQYMKMIRNSGKTVTKD